MELEEAIPTGKIIPTSETGFDFGRYRSLDDLDLDNVFYPIQQTQEAGIIFKDEAVKLRFESSSNMKHMICYSPKDASFVCLENHKVILRALNSLVISGILRL